jgi:hypothetical protein
VDNRHFQSVINRAIEILSQKNESVFSYCGIDLRSAVQRLLYIDAANSKQVKRLFGNPHGFFSVHLFYKRTDYDIARCCLDIPEASLTVKPILILVNIEYVKLAMRNFTRARRKRKKAVAHSTTSPVLAIMHHPKFMRLALAYFIENRRQLGFILASEDEKEKFGLTREDSVYMLDKMRMPFRFLSFRYPALSLLTEKYEQFIKDHTVQSVLTFEGDAPYHEIWAKLALKHGFYSNCIQWGAFPWQEPKIGFKNISHSCYFTWGEYFSKQLAPWNPETKFYSCGSPALEIGRTEVKQQILFIHQGYDDVLITHESYQAFWDLLLWVTDSFPDWEVIIRNHPVIPLTQEELMTVKQRNILHHDPQIVSLAESLTGTAIAVTIMSSTLIEAAAYGIIPVVFNPDYNQFSYKPDFKSEGLGLEEASIDALKEPLDGLMTDFDSVCLLREKVARFSAEMLFKATGTSSAILFQQALNEQRNKNADLIKA